MKSHPKLWDAYHHTVIAPRRAAMTAAVRRAVAAGELRDDIDVELIDELIVGPMLVRTIHRKDAPLDDDLAERILRALLEGLRPGTEPGTRPRASTGPGPGRAPVARPVTRAADRPPRGLARRASCVTAAR